MKMILYGSILILACMCMDASQAPYPWVKQWDFIYNGNIETAHQNLMTILQLTHGKINTLFMEQAQARIAKGHVFNTKLQEILDGNTVSLMLEAKRIAAKICAEARNTFDYKLNNKIHAEKQPTSAYATRTVRPHRKVLSNTHNKRAP